MPFSEMLEKLDEKQRNIIISSAAIFLVLVVCYQIYKSAIKKVVYYNNLYQETLTKSKLQKDLFTLDEARKKYEELIVNKQDIDNVKNNLSKIARACALKVISISSDTDRAASYSYNTQGLKTQPSDYYRLSIVKLEAEGSYHSLGNFVANIESSKPYMGVRSVEIRQPDNSSGSYYQGQQVSFNEAFKADNDTVAKAVIAIETYLLKR